jgi:hypothetical protein
MKKLMLILSTVSLALVFQGCPENLNEGVFYLKIINNSARDITYHKSIGPKDEDSTLVCSVNYGAQEFYKRIIAKTIPAQGEKEERMGVEEGLKRVYETVNDWILIFDKEKYLTYDWNHPDPAKSPIVKCFKIESFEQLDKMNWTVVYSPEK